MIEIFRREITAEEGQPTPKESAPDRLDTLRKWTRDVFIIAAVIILVINPAIIGRFLKEVKVQLTYDEAAKTWTVTANEANRDLATDISDLSTEAKALLAKVPQLAGGKTGADLDALSKAIQAFADKADAAQEAAATSLAQQQAAPGAPAGTMVADGWMLLGAVSDSNASAWTGRHNIKTDSPAGLQGKRLATTSNVLLREAGTRPESATDNTWHLQLKVAGAVKKGEVVQIVTTEVGKGADGGWSIWALIKRV